MSAELSPADDLVPSDLDERPQRRREWSGALRSVVLPVMALAVIVAAVWYLEAGRQQHAASPGTGLGVLTLDAARNHTGKPPAAALGRAAPDFRLLTLDGQPLRLSDLQGKVVLINFWASWCQPCRQEMPEIVRASTAYRDQGFAVVSVDEQEDDATVQKWVNEFAMPFPVAMDRTGQVGLAFRAGTQFPTSVWLDRNGVVFDVKYGPMTRQFLDDHVAALR